MKIKLPMTYTDYIALSNTHGKEAHRAYYAQFVLKGMPERVAGIIGAERLLSSKCEHLNDIPLETWDNMNIGGVGEKMKSLGDYLTLAGKNCIHKEAARQYIEQHKQG